MKKQNNLEPILEGEHIYLRKVRLADVNDNYYRWMNDAEVVRYLECRFAKNSMAAIKDFIEKIINDPDNVFLAIVLKNGDRHIGNIKIGPINRHHLFADVGLLIGEKDCWGKGYATEALRLVTDFAFKILKLHRLTAGCYAENKGSEKAFKKAGFVVEGIRKKHCYCDGKYVDSIMLGIVNEDFNAE